MRALYISHNGMLEGLGQSQVLGYLRGLAKRGVEFHLVSYEAAGANDEAIEALRQKLRGQGIAWSPLRRNVGRRFDARVNDSVRGVLQTFRLALAHRPDIVHGRSYLPTAIADVIATTVPRAKLVFDCRGMLGDEYVDAGHWTPDRFEYRLIKRYESRAFHRAQGVVVLTDALKAWIRARDWFGPKTHVETIPCCVDLDVFKFDEAARRRIRDELGFADRTVLVYSGSLGSWYREADLARFAGIAKRRAKGRIGFLVATRSDPKELTDLLRAEGLTDDEIRVRSVVPADMAAHLSAGDIGLSFIKSCFSKKGSSPTKVAEYLACGLPVVLNGDIGDQAALAAERETCVVVDEDFRAEALEEAAAKALSLAARPLADRVEQGRKTADEHFGLERVGVARYERLYRALASRR